MDIKRILIVIALFVPHFSFAQQVTNVDAFQSGDMIVVEYNIEGHKYLPASRKFNVVPSFSVDGGNKFTVLESVSGDLDNVPVGTDNRIIWYVTDVYDRFVHSEVIFKVEISQTPLATAYRKSHYKGSDSNNSSGTSQTKSTSNSVSASSVLGHMYYHKDIPDYQKAFELLSKGAEAGDAMALFYLGECHWYGRGTVKDESAALEAYIQSAAKGFHAAKEKLNKINPAAKSHVNSSVSKRVNTASTETPTPGADYYRKGEECERNKRYADAIKYYRQASQKGYKQADERIKALQLHFW